MIREVKSSEIDVLCELSRQTFIETFAAVNTPKDLQDYVNNPNLQKWELVKAQIDQPKYSVTMLYMLSHLRMVPQFVALCRLCKQFCEVGAVNLVLADYGKHL